MLEKLRRKIAFLFLTETEKGYLASPTYLVDEYRELGLVEGSARTYRFRIGTESFVTPGVRIGNSWFVRTHNIDWDYVNQKEKV